MVKESDIEIIAEIGKNFVDTPERERLDVLLEKAKRLVNEAVRAGADTVKFQLHNVSDEIHPNVKMIAPHFDMDRYAWVARNTYPVEFWRELYDYCLDSKVQFLATPMSRGAAILLNEDIGVHRWKIGSADITDFVLLDYIRNTGKPIILSSGMSTLKELDAAYNYIAEKVDDITILHCVSVYPCPPEALNLNTIKFLQKRFPKAKIGFSDHSIGPEGPLAACQLGARVIEKHFSLSRNLWGPDHKVSMEPEEMHDLVARIWNRDFEVSNPRMLGVETKFLNEEETRYRASFRKGLYAASDIAESDLLTPAHMIALRPQISGARPASEYQDFVGKMAGRNYKAYDVI